MLKTVDRDVERWRYPYAPTERQKVAHKVVADEILYGGAAGGGKSDWILAAHVTLALMVPGSRSLILRRTYGGLERSLIPRLLLRIPKSVASYNAGKYTWTFRNGSVIEFGHLQRENDVLKYQSAEYQRISFDELTHFTEGQFDYMRSRVRAGGEVRLTMMRLGIRGCVAAATNPGGPGHHWVKRRFIDPAPAGTVFRSEPTLENPRPALRVFIPAMLSDNPHLGQEYADTLADLDPMLRRALLEGDWDILEGVRFSAWRRNIHVIEPEQFPVPTGGGVPRAVGVDYGIDAPFSAHWGAKFGDGLIVVYREVYERGLTPKQQAEAIRDAEAQDERGPNRQIPIALDPACWARDPTQLVKSDLRDKDIPPPGSIASYYRDVFGSAVVKARNDRLAGAALLDEKMRRRPDGLPRILVYSTCTNFIRTLPALPRDSRHPEDVDTKAEDHAYDSVRYLLMEMEGRTAKRAEPPAGGAPPARPVTGGLQEVGF